MTIRDIAIALGFKVDDDSLKEAEGKINNIKNFAVKALGAIGIGFSLTQMNALAEEFNGINDQIRSATSALGDQKDIQAKIMQSANDTKMAYADTAKTVGALVQENKELFGNIDEAIAFNDALVKTFKTAGKSNEEIAGLMEAVNKSFAKGKVDTETLNQLMERSPEAVAYLNKQLGSTTDQLEQMAADGRISLSDLKEAFVSNTDAINEAFGNLDYSISDGMLNIRNKWGYWLDDINSSIGLTKTLAKYMTRAFDMIMKGLDRVKDIAVRVTEKFGGMENILRFIGIAAAAAIAAFKGKKILLFLKSFTSLLNVANLKIMAIIAVILAIALIIDDFINFMQGNNSVIGDVLKKMGYDVDEVRDRIITAWNKVKGFLTHVWMAISNIAGTVSGKLKEFWLKNGEEIMTRLTAIWDGLVTYLSARWNRMKESAEFIFGLLKAFWDQWGEKIKAAFSVIFEMVGNQFMAFLKVVQGFVDVIAGIFSGDWERVWQGAQEIITGIWEGILTFFTGIWEAIYALFGDKIDAVVELVAGFAKKIKDMMQGIKDFFGGIGDSIGDFASDVGDFFTGGATVTNTTVANASGTGNRTNNVRQDVNIENNYYGTDQKTMSQAATKTAEDTTDQLAKGLKYGT
ncbi:MAG: tape measure protein [Lachnospiraceae bacterium]|nr:tape measure protein [Lachnospiraceae bacterium]